MALYSFEHTQLLPAGPEQVWQFISSPRNLQHITPPHMGFYILTKNLPEKMYPGMIIAYKVSPVAGIKTTWVTEITQVDEGNYFVDEQRMGPYTMWHHQHHLKAVTGGVLMTDIVNYIPPLGLLGNIANSLFIRKKITEIFAFRTNKLAEHFG